jgi:DNA-binding SARP family transcriptional activator/class 3 adenylate cyclase
VSDGLERRLVAVMFTDMAGYTALMQADERRAVASRDRYMSAVEQHHESLGGTVVQRLGDGSLGMFPGVLAAVQAAIAIQREVRDLPVRIGIHVGEVFVEPERLTGDAVNVAARVESFAVPGSILLSDTAYEQVKNRDELGFAALGSFRFKNVGRPFELYAVACNGLVVPERDTLEGKGEQFVAVGSSLPEPPMEFRILGPLEVIEDGRPLDLGGHKQRALLAFLLLEPNRPVSPDRLVDALWEEAPTATARKALQVYVSQLRKVLGKGRVLTQAPGYLLRVDDDELDVTLFRRLRAERRPHEALALWRGSPLDEFAQHSFARGEIARLEELRLSCVEERIEDDLAEGRHVDLVPELEALVIAHPLRERLRELLLLALYRSGRQADALAAYQDARAALVDELGIEPRKRLRELQQAILRQDPALDAAPLPESPAEAMRGTFVGRSTELSRLIGGLDDALAGRGGLFLLVGEPGIGKSRIAEELIRVARTRGVGILVGRCWEASGAPAYWPWVQSLRGYVRDARPEALRSELGGGAGEVAQILPELRTILPGLAEPEPSESDSARFRLFDATVQFLQNAAARRPLLLFLDDLHAADTPSLLLLRFLARELSSTRLLVVAACRDVDPTPSVPLAAMLAEVAREPATTRLSLRGLTEAEVAAYVEATAAELASPELIEALYEETEGNPLFVGETVRLLAVEGRIAIPETIRDVITRRLAHLSDECNRVLTLASVLGREFPLDALALLSGGPEDDVLDTLDEAIAARVVADVPGSTTRLRFAHVLIRDTLYDGLTAARRVRLHRLAEEALERLYGDGAGPHLAELAHHAVAGNRFDKGAVCARRAGDQAVALLAYEEAARLYVMALDALRIASPDDEHARCALLNSLGEAETWAGNRPVAQETFLAAAELARRRGLAHELARAAAGYAGRIVWARAGDDERLVPLLEEGLAAVGEEDAELRARLLARLAGALRDEHDRSRRNELSAEAVLLARRRGNASALAYALAGRGHAIAAPDTVTECLELGSELCEVAAACGDREFAASGHMLRILAQHLTGDLLGAEVDLAAASHIAEELGQPAKLWEVRGARAMLALAEGRFDEGARLVEETFSLGERAVPEGAITHLRLQRCTLAEFRGGLEELAPSIEALANEYPARVAFRCALAYLQAQVGRHADARLVLGALAPGAFSALPFDQEWLFGMSLLAETAALVDDRDSAEALYRALLPWQAYNAVDQSEGMRGSVSRHVGLLAATLGRWSDAERHLEDALAANGRMGLRPWLARTQEDIARMLRLRGERGDPEQADRLESAARATYAELGVTR